MSPIRDEPNWKRAQVYAHGIAAEGASSPGHEGACPCAGATLSVACSKRGCVDIGCCTSTAV